MAAKRFIIHHQAMVSGQGEAEAREYQVAVDHKRNVIWFYTLQDADPGGHVYCHDPSDVNSQGFAGGTIIFKIGKTGIYHAKGPWHANTEALYKGTGVDLRDKHLTFVVVSKRRSYDDKHRCIMEDVLYMDEKPMLGLFDRGKGIAQKYADGLKEPVCLYSESGGGSSNGWEYPTGTEWKDWRDWFRQEEEIASEF